MTEIKVSSVDREWATIIRAELMKEIPNLSFYSTDIIPILVARIRHQARILALEEAARFPSSHAPNPSVSKLGDENEQIHSNGFGFGRTKETIAVSPTDAATKVGTAA